MSYLKRAQLAMLGASVLLAGATAQAANWELDPTVAVGATYSDNYLLDIGSAKTDVFGGEIDAELAFRNRGPRSEFAIAPRLNATFFPDAEDADSNDYFLNLAWDYRTQRGAWQLHGEYSRERVVQNEYLSLDPDLDLGETIGADGERISVRTDRELIWVRPSYTFDWTQRTRLELDARVYKTDYEERLGEEVPFTDLSARAGVAFQVSPLSRLTVRGTASRYSPDSAIDDTHRIGGEIQWSTERSKIARFYVRGGVRRSEFGTGAGTVSATGFVGGIGGSWRREVSQILVDLMRGVEPSAVGQVVNRDELRLRLERTLRPRLSTFAQLRGVRTETSFDQALAVALSDRDYMEARLGLEWRMRRQFSLLGEYGYRWQEYKVDPDSAAANDFELKVVYRPRRPE